HSEWLRAGLLTLMEKGAGLILSLGATVLLLRRLPREEFAAWGLFLLISYTLEMGRSGLLQNGIMRFWAFERDRPSEIKRLSTAAFTLNLLFSCLSNLILWLGLPWLLTHFQAPQLKSLLMIYLLSNVIMVFSSHLNYIQQANFEFRGIFLNTLCYRGALFLWVLGASLAGSPLILQHLAWAMMLGALAGAFASSWFGRPYLQFSFHWEGSWMLRLLQYGKYVLGTNLCAMMYKSVDKLALGSMIGPAAFAIYDAAGKITQLIETPSFSIAAVVFPQSAARGASGVQGLYERSVGAILAIILPFLVLVVLFAEPLMLLFAGPKYLESANILRYTAFFGLFMPFVVQSGTILDSNGLPGINLAFTAGTALLNLALNVVFIPHFGLFGAAYATLCGYFLSFLAIQSFLYAQFGIRWWHAFGWIPNLYKLGFRLLLSKKSMEPLGLNNK
ncbi:MAG: flippase, partial [Bacteroidetes bacterium]|nr:flippase [Bacteroidota bacterium]